MNESVELSRDILTREEDYALQLLTDGVLLIINSKLPTLLKDKRFESLKGFNIHVAGLSIGAQPDEEKTAELEERIKTRRERNQSYFV